VQASFCFVNTDVKFAGAYNTRITLYRREAATLDAGQLQLSKITTFTDPGAPIVRMLLHAQSPTLAVIDYHACMQLFDRAGVQTSPPDLDGTLFLGLVSVSQP